MGRLLSGAGALLASAVLSCASTASAAVLYATDFEAPTFATGSIVGQDGWTATSGAGNVTIQNAPAAAHSGSQFAFYNTVNATNAVPSKFAWKPINAPASTFTSEPILVASVFTAIASNPNTTRTAVAGLDLYNIAGQRIAALNFGTDGTVLPLDPSGAVALSTPTTASLDQYNRLTITVNFQNQNVRYFFNGTEIATSTSANATDFGDGDIYSIRTSNPAGSSGGHQILWDDLAIGTIAIPEPMTFIVIAPAAAALLVSRRRRAPRGRDSH
jgi:hypothetical protein